MSFSSLDEYDDDPLNKMRGQQRVFTTQLTICLFIGISSFFLFCILRHRWPHIYAVRTLRKSYNSPPIKPLPKSYFGWLLVIFSITDEELLNYSGLDAYVYLEFFRMGITIFSILSVLAIGILSPIRYYFTGNYDKDDISWILIRSLAHYTRFDDEPGVPPDFSDDFPQFMWVYPIFTYLFSFIIYYYLYNYTTKVLRVRQKYLASQNSITDRTIRLDGIPKKLLSADKLKQFVENLQIGKVSDIKLLYDWTPLEKLFERREKIISSLERYYSTKYNLTIDIYNQDKIPSVLPDLENIKENVDTIKIDKQIKILSQELIQVDNSIKKLQHNQDDPSFKRINSAFITMESVASAQMASQTLLDPRVYKLMVSLAPAPKDIQWNNFRLTNFQRILTSYSVTIIIILSYAFIIFLVVPLASLLEIKTITKFWPALGKLISTSKWLTTFVTGILPPLLFSALSVSTPFFYKYLSQNQGYFSNSEIELSTLSKNFFYNFFVLFLVFVITGTIWDYLSYISDTTKIAYKLASSLKNKSLFYVDLILLQGLAMFPVKLLQISDFVVLNVIGKLFLIKNMFLRTPRDYRAYYFTPQIFDFGIHLPQHILIFIIILIYSVLSTKIVTSGLVYFILGYFVYKYQLVYNFVHPPHSTGKVWPMIFRRILLGLIIFQLFMCGTMALESAILLSALCAPLIIVTGLVLWNFEKYYVPLSTFIALRAIQNPFNFDKEFDDERSSSSEQPSRSETPQEYDTDDSIDDENANPQSPGNVSVTLDESSFLLSGDHSIYNQNSALTRRRSTIDEEREKSSDYTYPYLLDPLHGPWVGFEGDIISMVTYNHYNLSDLNLEDGDFSIISQREEETIIRKRLRVNEWE
ncbi:uncharacterized protein RJT21DRAFT_19461 [Scheffersomyces amazonensis]|uniref:uncharacterized protein n=1 Tax=Scheffersomyces amazonensis TaxID=1078765 RepID=UPI00315DD317